MKKLDDYFDLQEEIFKYKERLEAAGCKKIIYIGLNEWVPLPVKWWNTSKYTRVPTMKTRHLRNQSTIYGQFRSLRSHRTLNWDKIPVGNNP